MPVKPPAELAFMDKLGHLFSNGRLLQEALTHSTYAYEHRLEALPSNERLEFLGDAVLDLAVSEYLFSQPEILNEGCMTQTRSLIVCEKNLAQLAISLGIGELLQLGKGERQTGGREKPSNLANAMEAVWGAVFLDAGYEAVRDIILRLMGDSIQQALSGKIVFDFKSQLLELVQAYKSPMIRFEILEEKGPVHERVFTAGVFLHDNLMAQGSGPSKKEAEQQAARRALVNLEKDLSILKD
jgi:ribonuclease III